MKQLKLNMLGLCYERCHGVFANLGNAHEWFKKPPTKSFQFHGRKWDPYIDSMVDGGNSSWSLWTGHRVMWKKKYLAVVFYVPSNAYFGCIHRDQPLKILTKPIIGQKKATKLDVDSRSSLKDIFATRKFEWTQHHHHHHWWSRLQVAVNIQNLHLTKTHRPYLTI